MPSDSAGVCYDAVIIGSGIGGAMAAHRLVHAGWRVLVLERGDRVRRGPENSDAAATLEFSPHYSRESEYSVLAGGYGVRAGAVFCLGGPSVYFGAAAIRFREADFLPCPSITAQSNAEWPFRYADLEPHYAEAERLMGVAGDDTLDPTRPPRTTPYPWPPAPLRPVSMRFRDAARSLGLSPARLPLAINYDGSNGRRACTACRTCDTYACAVQAKNDMDVAVLSPLERRGLEIRVETVVTRLVTNGDGHVTVVQAWDKRAGELVEFRARYVLLAAGALASPHLLLASGLDRAHPSGRWVGRYLTRHCSAMVFGFCSFRPDPDPGFHKQLIVLDYYFGDSRCQPYQGERLGSIQQVTTPPAALMAAHMPPFINRLPLAGFAEHLCGALAMAEDEPRPENWVALDPAATDAFGVPRLCVRHTYTRADRRRRAALVARAKRILRACGAWSFHTHNLKTFSHALGTVRMGHDSAGSPLDRDCRYRGLENLLVVDGSALPTSAGVNPGLTIAANALRAADRLVRADGERTTATALHVETPGKGSAR